MAHNSSHEEIKVLQFKNLKNLNTSLQVGDILYGCDYDPLLDGVNKKMGNYNNSSEEKVGSLTKKGRVVGIERIIGKGASPGWNLLIALSGQELIDFNDQDGYFTGFIMFSKVLIDPKKRSTYQSDGNILGYYAQTNFINNSPHKAELFSIGSNVTESSK